MVAAFDVTYDNAGVTGTPGAETTISNLRFNTADNNTQDLASPLIIPLAGTIFSFWKQVYLKASAAPDTQVNQVKLYSDGTLGWGTGITVQVGDGTQVKTSLSSAGYIISVAQVDIVTRGDVSAKTSLFTFTVGSPRVVSISEVSNIITAIGQTTDYVVLQTDVASTATPGTKPVETITYQYDEI